MPSAASSITSVTAAQLAADPAMMLRAQLNRFANPFAPAGYRLFEDPLPLTGPVDGTVALRAGAVMIKRLIDQPGRGFDPMTDALAGHLADDFTGALTRANLVLITGIVSGFADAHGLPKPVTGLWSALTQPSLLYAILGGLLLGGGFFYWKRRRA